MRSLDVDSPVKLLTILFYHHLGETQQDVLSRDLKKTVFEIIERNER